MSRISRVYLPSGCFSEQEVRPPEETTHYLGRVLRLRPGDRWAALDGEGRSWLCEILGPGVSRRLDDWPAIPPLPVKVEVGLALCKGQRFEDALEKLAELGVARVVPLETARTERGLPSPAKAKRWQQIALSGSALANRLVPLEVAAPAALPDYVDGLERSTAVYCHRDGDRPSDVFSSARRAYTILIGPEGGFSEPELESLRARARKVSLGPLTLRVETAAVCAASLALACSPEP